MEQRTSLLCVHCLLSIWPSLAFICASVMLAPGRGQPVFATASQNWGLQVFLLAQPEKEF